jgi:diaminohydroxyphosphoribosylaminopyrimidine deaminase/5-amino-6-(5-phosphoribosylamino)uracil reductase
MTDPNPRVSGAGLQKLRDSGIEVTAGLREPEARRMNEAFCLSIQARRAFVHVKLAATLDGRIATRTGHSRWITSEASRLRVHRLRDACGAIIVGARTAAADDPKLTVRLPGKPERRIRRVVLDPLLRTPTSLAMLRPDEAPYTVIACSAEPDAERADRLEGCGVSVLRLPTADGRLDLGALLARLYAEGTMEVLVEGGGETARGFLEAGLADRVHLFLAPKLLGGRDAIPMLGGTSPDRMEEALTLADLEVERVGPDLYVTGLPARR